MASTVEPGTEYYFTVQAVNANGESAHSDESNRVTPECSEEPAAQGAGQVVVASAVWPPPFEGWFCSPTIGCEDGPCPPENVVATAGDESATITWDPALSNHTNVTYTVTADHGGHEVTVEDATEVTIDGLTNGDTYTFTVTAEDADGVSEPSDPSNEVTPMPSIPPPDTSDERWVRYPSTGTGPGAGLRVLLSPAGHHPDREGCVATSGAQYNENIGARATTTQVAINLQNQGYEVFVSNRDGTEAGSGMRGEGLYNCHYAIELGVDLHVPIHSNAPGDDGPFTGADSDRRCDSSHPDSSDPDHGGTLMVWYTDQQEQDSISVLGAISGLLGPGGLRGNGLFERNVAELRETSQAGIRAIYFEVAFHTELADVDWMETIDQPAAMVTAGIRHLLDGQ